MAADLVAMVEAVVPGKFVLVAHSMGGLIARRAAESLEPRLQGLLLVDPTPETAPMYDAWDQTAQKIDHNLAVAQALIHIHPLARLAARNIRRLFPEATYQTMLTENFTPASIAQMRNENRAVLTAVRHYRDQPPNPRNARPSCSRPPARRAARSAPCGKPKAANTNAATPKTCPTDGTRASTRGISSRPNSHPSSLTEHTNFSIPRSEDRSRPARRSAFVSETTSSHRSVNGNGG